jgi:hypothetical protein
MEVLLHSYKSSEYDHFKEPRYWKKTTKLHFINQVAIKVHVLEMDYKILSEKLPTKLEDIFEPIVKTKVWINEIATLCDIGATVSTVLKVYLIELTLVHLLLLSLNFMKMILHSNKLHKGKYSCAN